jgi:hypothetical protein
VAGAFRIPQILGYLKRDGTDRDRDGLPDARERKNCRRCGTVSNPQSDPDRDGLDHAAELAGGTQPKKPDSGGEGARDGKGVANGTKPAYPNR